jgi:hypothetical protein
MSARAHITYMADILPQVKGGLIPVGELRTELDRLRQKLGTASLPSRLQVLYVQLGQMTGSYSTARVQRLAHQDANEQYPADAALPQRSRWNTNGPAGEPATVAGNRPDLDAPSTCEGRFSLSRDERLVT